MQVREPDGQAAEVPVGPGDEAVVEAGEQHEAHPGQGGGGGGQDVTQAVGGPDGQAAEVPGGPGDEAVVEGEGGAGGT